MASKRIRLAQRRKSVGFSQEQLAERLGVERSTVVRWESGDTEPQPWMRPKLARVLQVSADVLGELLATAENPPDEDRLRHAIGHPTGVDLVAVAHLRQRVQSLDAQYDRAPSASLLAEAGQCLGQVGYLRSHASTSTVRRDLLAVEAEAATLMGQLVWDASQRRDHLTARGFFDQAIVAARQVHDTVAEGRALLRTSFVALYGERDPNAGLQLASQTADVARGASQVLTGMALLHVAEAHAMMQSRSDTDRALGDAEQCFGRFSAIDEAVELYSPTHHGRLAGSCYLFLNDPQQAQPVLESTAREFHPGSKSHAIVLSNLALAFIRQRKLDEGVDALHSAIDVVEQTWGAGGLNLIFTAGRELRPWKRTAVVQDVYDRLLTLIATR